MCLDAAGTTAPAWRQADFLAGAVAGSGIAAVPTIPTVPYGSFTGRHLQTGGGPLPAHPPRYLIELLADSAPGAGADRDGLRYLYRITAMGFGARETTRVMLQSFYRKQDGASGAGARTAPVDQARGARGSRRATAFPSPL